MGRLTITDTPVAGLKVITRTHLGDSRGFLARLFCSTELAAAGWAGPVAQINHTFTKRRGTVRGMHYQRAPHQETKLISCIRGAVLDVGVDLRAGSPTFLQCHAEELSPETGRAMLIPAGCAHGFQALTDDCELVYVHSAPHVPTAEAGVSPLDALIARHWPLEIVEMSPRDTGLPMLQQFQGEGR